MADALLTMAHDGLPAAHAFGDVSYAPVPPLARCVFRGEEPAQERLARALVCERPQPLRAARAENHALLWQGPDETLVIAKGQDGPALARMIAEALGPVPHSCVDVSYRHVGFTLTGARVGLLLSTAVMLDLDVRAFPVGMATRTLLAKADIVLWRLAEDQFHIETWRSFAPYVLGILAEGARGL